MGAKRAGDRPPEIQHYIDEAGDLTLFDKKGHSLLGQPGVSACFMVGAAWLDSPSDVVSLNEGLEILRAELMADPFLQRVPSMDPGRRKTALAFHAKDDCAEVRHRVFNAILNLDVKVVVAIRRKASLIDDARNMFRYGAKLSENDVYDDLVKRILKQRLHLAGQNTIIFSRRGTRSRRDALARAIRRAKENFAAQYGEREFPPTTVLSLQPSENPGLQVVDYLLWALQRFYERREERYLVPLLHKYRLVMDLDDTRKVAYGEWFSDSNPLALEKVLPVTS